MTEAPDDHVLLPPAVDLGAAPILFFDGVPTLGGADIIHLSLSCIRFLAREGKVESVPTVVAHLRCSRGAAALLRDSIDRALLMAAPTEGPAN